MGSHAPVTAGFYDRQMLGTERHIGQGAAGVLIIRAWREGSSADPQLRVRMIGQQDLASNWRAIATASTVGDALAYVGDWLQRFSASGQ
jgi:hypothetical protein